FKAFSNFVSHVTGDFGHLAISITRFSVEDSLIWLIIPISFLLGSITSGLSTSAKKIKGHLPQYFHLVFLMSFCYALIVTFYQLQVFNLPLGSHYKVVDIFSIILLSYACGIQNALFTSASGAVVRTTHLTGLTTDLGIGIANYFSKKYDRKEGRSNKLRFTLIFSFTFGGIVG